jgi:hypothetical protein
MKYIEDESRYTILPEKHFIIKLSKDTSFSADFSSAIFEEYPPLILYYRDCDLYILYGASEKEHIFNGERSVIASHYASLATLSFGEIVHASLIEFESKTAVCSYFITLIFDNIRRVLNAPKDSQLTQDELIKQFGKTKWNKIPDEEKYGYFIKKKNGEIIKKAEKFDFFKIEDHKKFLF